VTYSHFLGVTVEQPSDDRFHNKLADFHNKPAFFVKLLPDFFTKIREAFTKKRFPPNKSVAPHKRVAGVYRLMTAPLRSANISGAAAFRVQMPG
jgi:hypothetical protein